MHVDCIVCLPLVKSMHGDSIALAVQIRPLEETYKFGAFFSSYLNESDFYAKPSVLLLGQYSTGTACVPMLICGLRELDHLHVIAKVAIP